MGRAGGGDRADQRGQPGGRVQAGLDGRVAGLGLGPTRAASTAARSAAGAGAAADGPGVGPLIALASAIACSRWASRTFVIIGGQRRHLDQREVVAGQQGGGVGQEGEQRIRRRRVGSPRAEQVAAGGEADPGRTRHPEQTTQEAAAGDRGSHRDSAIGRASKPGRVIAARARSTPARAAGLQLARAPACRVFRRGAVVTARYAFDQSRGPLRPAAIGRGLYRLVQCRAYSADPPGGRAWRSGDGARPPVPGRRARSARPPTGPAPAIAVAAAAGAGRAARPAPPPGRADHRGRGAGPRRSQRHPGRAPLRGPDHGRRRRRGQAQRTDRRLPGDLGRAGRGRGRPAAR